MKKITLILFPALVFCLAILGCSSNENHNVTIQLNLNSSSQNTYENSIIDALPG